MNEEYKECIDVSDLNLDMSALIINDRNSRLSDLIDNIKKLDVTIAYKDRISGEECIAVFNEPEKIRGAPVFLVQRDWGKLLDGVNPSDNEVRLPYDSCIFEFVFPDVNLLYWVEGEFHVAFMEFSNQNRGWGATFLRNGEHQETIQDAPWTSMWNTIKAICVVLDAEVAETEVIRAPYKLNKKRIKKGKTPHNDYHIVNLARRHRISNPLDGHSGGRHRWHLRRGHWRHYEDHKTWVKWYFAGDPALGTITKDYTI